MDEIRTLFKKVEADGIYELSDITRLAELVGLEQEWAEADGESFEEVYTQVMDKAEKMLEIEEWEIGAFESCMMDTDFSPLFDGYDRHLWQGAVNSFAKKYGIPIKKLLKWEEEVLICNGHHLF